MSSVIQWRASSRALGHEARQARNEQILDLWKAGGLTAEDIGARFDVAPSTVVFALRSARKRGDPRAVSRSDSIWTPELTERAAQMRRDGYSSSRIAAALGQGITRNAVIGRLARMGERPIVVTKVKIRIPKVKIRIPKVLKWTPEPAPEPIAILVSRRVTIHELESGMCRFPLGDALTPEFRYCGADCDPARSYCGPHHRTAYSRVA